MEKDKVKLASWGLMLSGLAIVLIVDHTSADKDMFGMDWKTQRKIGGAAIALGALGIVITTFSSIKK